MELIGPMRSKSKIYRRDAEGADRARPREILRPQKVGAQDDTLRGRKLKTGKERQRRGKGGNGRNRKK